MKKINKLSKLAAITLITTSVGTGVSFASETNHNFDFKEGVNVTSQKDWVITETYVPGFSEKSSFEIKNSNNKDGIINVKLHLDKNAEEDKCLEEFLINGKKAEDWKAGENYLVKSEKLKAGEKKGIETTVELPFEATACNRSLTKGEMKQNPYVVTHEVTFTLVEESPKPTVIGRLVDTGFGSLAIILLGGIVGMLGGVLYWFTRKNRRNEVKEQPQETSVETH